MSGFFRKIFPKNGGRLSVRLKEEGIMYFLAFKKSGIRVDSKNPWKLTIPDTHIHIDLPKDSNELSYRDVPLSAEGATFEEAMQNLLKLEKEHAVAHGNVCSRNCKHYVEF